MNWTHWNADRSESHWTPERLKINSLCLWHSLGSFFVVVGLSCLTFFFKCNIITYTYFVLDERRRSRSRVKCWSLFFKPIFRCTCTISIEHFWAKKMSNFSVFLLFRCLLRFFNAAICSTYHKIPRFYWMTLHTRFGQKRYSYLLPFVSHQRRVFDHSPSRRLIELKFWKAEKSKERAEKCSKDANEKCLRFSFPP